MTQILTRRDISDWKQHPVTRVLLKTLGRLKYETALVAVEAPVPEDQVWMIRGKIEQINMIIPDEDGIIEVLEEFIEKRQEEES